MPLPDDLEFYCDVCGTKRLGAHLEVLHLPLPGHELEFPNTWENFKYCRDDPDCAAKARLTSFTRSRALGAMRSASAADVRDRYRATHWSPEGLPRGMREFPMVAVYEPQQMPGWHEDEDGEVRGPGGLRLFAIIQLGEHYLPYTAEYVDFYGDGGTTPGEAVGNLLASLFDRIEALEDRLEHQEHREH